MELTLKHVIKGIMLVAVAALIDGLINAVMGLGATAYQAIPWWARWFMPSLDAMFAATRNILVFILSIIAIFALGIAVDIIGRLWTDYSPPTSGLLSNLLVRSLLEGLLMRVMTFVYWFVAGFVIEFIILLAGASLLMALMIALIVFIIALAVSVPIIGLASEKIVALFSE